MSRTLHLHAEFIYDIAFILTFFTLKSGLRWRLKIQATHFLQYLASPSLLVPHRGQITEFIIFGRYILLNN